MQQYPINVVRQRINPTKMACFGCSALTILLWVMPDGCGHIFMSAREHAREITCLSNLKELSLGVLQYSQDWDETLPAGKSWADEITRYIKPVNSNNESVFQCPDADAIGKKGAGGIVYSYAYNIRLSRLAFKHLDEPAGTVMLYESHDAFKNAADAFTSVQTPGRHAGGDNIAFTDGHVRRVNCSQFDAMRKAVEQNRPKSAGK